MACWAWCALTAADADEEPVCPEASSQVSPPPMIIRAARATAPISSTVRRERGVVGSATCSRFLRAPNKIPLPLLNLLFGAVPIHLSAGAVKRISRAARLWPDPPLL